MSGSRRPLAKKKDEWKQWVDWDQAEQDAAGQSTEISASQKGEQEALREDEVEEEETPPDERIPGGLASPFQGLPLTEDKLKELCRKAVDTEKEHHWPLPHTRFVERYLDTHQDEVSGAVDWQPMKTIYKEFYDFRTRKAIEHRIDYINSHREEIPGGLADPVPTVAGSQGTFAAFRHSDRPLVSPNTEVAKKKYPEPSAELKALYERALKTGTKMTKGRRTYDFTDDDIVFLRQYVAAYVGKNGATDWPPFKKHFKGYFDYHTEAAMKMFIKNNNLRDARSTSGHT